MEISYEEFYYYINNNKHSLMLTETFLIYGERLLVNECSKILIEILIPNKNNTIEIETFDLSVDFIEEILLSLNTFSMSKLGKIIILKNINILELIDSKNTILNNIKIAAKNGDLEKASNLFLMLISFFKTNTKNINNIDFDKMFPKIYKESWLKETICFCKKNKSSIPKIANKTTILEKIIKNGLIDKHHIIILSDKADKKKQLFKTINKTGIIINCSISKETKFYSVTSQKLTLRKIINTILHKKNKTINNEAFIRLLEITGENFSILSSNINKLIDYTEKNNKITIGDVNILLEKTKEDPIFEFTNSLIDKNATKSLQYLYSILENNIHPLQILTALTNQVRKLIIIHDFLMKNNMTKSQIGTFEQFKIKNLSLANKYDEKLLETICAWNQLLSYDTKKTLEKHDSNLFLLKKQNMYYFYSLAKKANKFTKKSLFEIMEIINKTDIDIKSINQNPKSALEQLVLIMCNN